MALAGISNLKLILALLIALTIGLVLWNYGYEAYNGDRVDNVNPNLRLKSGIYSQEPLHDEYGPWPGSIVYTSPENHRRNMQKQGLPLVNLAVVTCGQEIRLMEAITMIKSALIFSKFVRLHVLVLTKKETQQFIADKLNELLNSAKVVGLEFDYAVYRTWFLKSAHVNWSTLYAPCATQRLFFLKMFQWIDSLIFADSDSLFMSDLSDMWSHFKLMSSSQLAGVAPENELPGNGWYNLNSKIPYYGKRGLNAGVILMNLTRMRLVGFEYMVDMYWRIYGKLIVLADQDILNIIFHFYPEYLYQLDCKYDFRYHHCICYDLKHDDLSKCQCSSVNDTGVAVFHGNGGVFRRRYPKFEFARDVYAPFEKYNISSQDPGSILSAIKSKLGSTIKPCQLKTEKFLAKFESYIAHSKIN